MKTDKYYLRVSKETSFTANLNFKDKMIFYKLADSFNNILNFNCYTYNIIIHMLNIND